MSEAIFKHLVHQRGVQDQWVVDSAGLADWHEGNPPDPRAMKVLEKNGITGYHHICRVIRDEDFTKFDYIFVMDRWNVSDITQYKPKSTTAKIQLLGQCDPQKQLIIEDPFCTHGYNKNAFKEVFAQCYRCCQAFLDSFKGHQ